jgi:hypothetical protein
VNATPATFDELVELVLRRDLPASALFGPIAPAAGQDPRAALRAARRGYRSLARLAHPDVVPAARRAEAAAVFARLSELWAAYQRTPPGPAAGPGDHTGTVLAGRDRWAYTVGVRHAAGDVATLYRAARAAPAAGAAGTDDPPYLIKIANSPDDDDLVAREAAALRRIARLGDPRYAPYLPRLVDTARFDGGPGGGPRRRANVLGRLDGFVSLAQVRAAYPGGIDVRDAAWMWRRLLVALGHAHRAGVAHGAVLPEHVLIHPGDHGLVLADWCYSAVPDPTDDAVVGRPWPPAAGAGGDVRGGPRSDLCGDLGDDIGCGADDPARRIPALVERYADWYPPEVVRREPPGAATDLAMASRCVAYLLGDPEPARLRGAVPAPVCRFLAACVLPAPAMRPDDAWGLLGELDELLGRLYGPRRFRPFSMPAA